MEGRCNPDWSVKMKCLQGIMGVSQRDRMHNEHIRKELCVDRMIIDMCMKMKTTMVLPCGLASRDIKGQQNIHNGIQREEKEWSSKQVAK